MKRPEEPLETATESPQGPSARGSAAPCRAATSPGEANRGLYLGIDVGGTNIKLGLVDATGEVRARDQIATCEPEGAASAVERIGEACRRMVEVAGVRLEELRGAGLATPGTMDIARGWMLDPPNMPHWSRFPIRDALSSELGLPVAFLNDANAAAFGEYWVGGGANSDSLAMITLGTGVGGGLIVDGRIIHGLHSFGSEIGHMIVDPGPQARLCVWGGGRGELEAYASASAVVARAAERLSDAPQSRLAGVDPLTARAIYESAEAGDTLSLELIDETARILGIAITTLVHLIDPGRVLLGGAMDFGGMASPVGRRFLEGIRSEFLRRAFRVVDQTQIEFATLGSDAGFIGAAGFAHQQLTVDTP